MKELYNEFFRVPKQGKIKEKVMLVKTAVTVIIMVICLAAMSITAYAHFSYNVASASNIIKGANFEADVSVTITENNGGTDPEIIKGENASVSVKLEGGKTYTVTIDENVNSTADTGFCVIKAEGCPDTYHTQQLGADATVSGEFTDKIVFQLKVTADTTVTVLSHWGTSSYYADYAEKGELDSLYITNDNINEKKVVMIINDISEAECDASTNAENETPTTNAASTQTSNESTASEATVTTSSAPTVSTESSQSATTSQTETETTSTQSSEESVTNSDSANTTESGAPFAD